MRYLPRFALLLIVATMLIAACSAPSTDKSPPAAQPTRTPNVEGTRTPSPEVTRTPVQTGTRTPNPTPPPPAKK